MHDSNILWEVTTRRNTYPFGLEWRWPSTAMTVSTVWRWPQSIKAYIFTSKSYKNVKHRTAAKLQNCSNLVGMCTPYTTLFSQSVQLYQKKGEKRPMWCHKGGRSPSIIQLQCHDAVRLLQYQSTKEDYPKKIISFCLKKWIETYHVT